MFWVDDVRRLPSNPDRPTAIFAVNDMVAALTLQTALSMEQPFRAMGTAAVGLLSGRMGGGKTDMTWTLLPPKLVVRDSSGPNTPPAS